MVLLNFVILIFIGILGFVLKRSITQIDIRLKEEDLKGKDLLKELGELKEKRGLDREYFAKEYVAKDDFIRDIHTLDFKIDSVAADVKKLLGQFGDGRPK